jgi:16S rRNA G966 N2-methylase RsmD
MWSYYGSKSKLVDLYPKPKHDLIIEPFAGSARYALKYFDRDVLLIDKYNKIVQIWKWLQNCSINDIKHLPNVKQGETINREMFDCDEQFYLMGFLVQDGVNSPRLTMSKFGANTDFEVKKKNIYKNLFKIKHWKIELGSYAEIENYKATWFIDPPYQYGGEYYVESNKKIDFCILADWCKSRNGQIIVCENTKANWLPFKPMIEFQGTIHKTIEAIWCNERTSYDCEQVQLF